MIGPLLLNQGQQPTQARVATEIVLIPLAAAHCSQPLLLHFLREYRILGARHFEKKQLIGIPQGLISLKLKIATRPIQHPTLTSTQHVADRPSTDLCPISWRKRLLSLCSPRADSCESLAKTGWTATPSWHESPVARAPPEP